MSTTIISYREKIILSKKTKFLNTKTLIVRKYNNFLRTENISVAVNIFFVQVLCTKYLSTRLGLQCRTPLRSYTSTLIPYPLFLIPIDLGKSQVWVLVRRGIVLKSRRGIVPKGRGGIVLRVDVVLY